jgi:hypothetical protein
MILQLALSHTFMIFTISFSGLTVLELFHPNTSQLFAKFSASSALICGLATWAIAVYPAFTLAWYPPPENFPVSRVVFLYKTMTTNCMMVIKYFTFRLLAANESTEYVVEK